MCVCCLMVVMWCLLLVRLGYGGDVVCLYMCQIGSGDVVLVAG